MPSESAATMRKAYAALIKLTEKATFLTEKEEAKVCAEIEIQYGLSPTRATRMIDNMVKTGRVSRHITKGSKLDMSILDDKTSKPSKKEEEEIDKILKAKVKGK